MLVHISSDLPPVVIITVGDLNITFLRTTMQNEINVRGHEITMPYNRTPNSVHVLLKTIIVVSYDLDTHLQ